MSVDNADNTIESVTIDRTWKGFEAHTIPPHVPPDDFTRMRMRESYYAGAATIALIWQRCERESPERRLANMDRLVKEVMERAPQLDEASKLEQAARDAADFTNQGGKTS